MSQERKISVVYHSGTGHTRAMAEAVYEGLRSEADITAKIFSINGSDIVEGRWNNSEIMSELDSSDAIIFGSPTYMGGVSAQMKAFLDATSEKFFTRKWENKIAAAFTVSGCPAGDKLNTINSIFITAMQLGMIWVGQNSLPYNPDGSNRLGFFTGAAGQALLEPPDQAPNAEDKLGAKLLGIRVAKIAKQFLF